MNPRSRILELGTDLSRPTSLDSPFLQQQEQQQQHTTTQQQHTTSFFDIPSFKTQQDMEFTIPDRYGYVILTCLVGQVATNTYLGGCVMQARTKYGVPYPNLYAAPGFHKDADNFNRVQRGHQSMLETAPSFMVMSLLAGLQ